MGCEPRYGDKNFFSTPVHTSPGAHPEGFLAAEKPGSGIYRSLLRSDEVEKSIANFYFPSVPPWHVMGRPLPLHIWLNNHNIHRAAKNSLHAGGYVSVELNEKNISMEHLKCSKCLPASLIYFLSFFPKRANILSHKPVFYHQYHCKGLRYKVSVLQTSLAFWH